MTWEVPGRTEDHYPEGACRCGTDRGRGGPRGHAVVPAGGDPGRRVRAVRQHDLHAVKCPGCGREHCAPRPAGVPAAALSIGPRLRALCVYLVVHQHVPVERCRQLIADVTGAAVSDGFIHSCLAEASSLAAGTVAVIRALIAASPVAGSMRRRCGPARPGRRSTSTARSPSGSRRLPGRPQPGLHGGCGSCRISRESRSPTGTRITGIPGGSTSAGTRHAVHTCCATSRTAPRPTPAPSGPCRRSVRYAAWTPCLARRP